MRTLSKTERLSKSRSAWKVRAMPSLARAAGGSLSIATPARRSLEEAPTGCSPLITLSSVDFPEPFGPITPVNPPGMTSRSTPSSARSPPKLTVSRSASRWPRDGAGPGSVALICGSGW